MLLKSLISAITTRKKRTKPHQNKRLDTSNPKWYNSTITYQIKPNMNVLIACEFSGIVRDCFDALGHNAVSCDLLPSESPHGIHIQGDCIPLLYHPDRYFDFLEWDLVIAHPPCTYLSSSGLHWNKRQPSRALKTEEALNFVTKIWKAPCKKLVLENPVGCINTRLEFMPKPQYIQPYNFGEDASKRTGLWSRGLLDLEPVGQPIQPRIVDGKPRWGNQSDSGQSRLGGGSGHERSKTYFGIAAAMASQWG